MGRLVRVAAVSDDREGASVPAIKVASQMLGDGPPGRLNVVVPARIDRECEAAMTRYRRDRDARAHDAA
ncbi:MAG: hypothetical protein ACXWXR_08810, partial [Candidatus Limnocylindrales bacterium]